MPPYLVSRGTSFRVLLLPLGISPTRLSIGDPSNFGDATETGGAAVHVGKFTFAASAHLHMLKSELLLCSILKSEETVVGRWDGDRSDAARK